MAYLVTGSHGCIGARVLKTLVDAGEIERFEKLLGTGRLDARELG